MKRRLQLIALGVGALAIVTWLWPLVGFTIMLIAFIALRAADGIREQIKNDTWW